MTFPSDAWIGCSLDAGKGQTFVQLVGPGRLFERKVLASAFGADEEDALDKAMKIAGVDSIRGRASVVDERPAAPRQLVFDLDPSAVHERPAGLLAACRQLGIALDGLAEAVHVFGR